MYVHFPWCRKRCPYCDFAVELGDPPHDEYLTAVTAELHARAAAFAGPATTIYFGGGTPSLWRPDCLAAVIERVRDRFGGAPREITLEANPTDCTPANLDAWRAAGFTRVSIGVQSHDPSALVTLGRDHRFGDGRSAVAAALAAGFEVSADFILGVPGATTFDPDLSAPHLSIYELTIEERTAFGQRVRDGRLVPLPDEDLAALYTHTHETLAAAGYEHYEISSYARLGHRAVHNSLYWRGVPYLGLGVGAASLALTADGAGRRQTNPRRASEYLVTPGVPADLTDCTPAEMAADRAWLGMRTSDGVEERDLRARGVADWLVSEGLAVRHAARITPTLRGFLFADRIAARIVQNWEPA